jgi:hypothetical protein
MKKIILLALLLLCIAAAFSCGGNQPVGGSDTPTEAYKRLYKAVKSKNIDSIKQELSEKTIAFGKAAAAQYGKPEEKMYENGFTATTFSDSLPAIRDERVLDNMGAVEVWNSRESRWEDLPFVLENGVWKLAVGDAFGGSYKSPGKGRDLTEREAANAISGNGVKMLPAPNTNGSPTIITPKGPVNVPANKP